MTGEEIYEKGAYQTEQATINNSLMSLAVDIIDCRAKFLSGYPYAYICEEIS